ncbi:MAG: type II toxin-antitoxin system HicA family toxin [Clostridiales bacterium]|nr:type II toxin-antitoxin system HicA family toxin [Clostridiales bacterium]
MKRPQTEKKLQNIKSRPKDFTFDEAETLLKCLNYIRSNRGRTSGSRIMFISEKHEALLLHKPHPQKELKAYQVKQLIELRLPIPEMGFAP